MDNKKIFIASKPAPRDAWDKLSLEAKAGMMEVAVKNGIYDLKEIREKYNEFAEGGNKKPVTTGGAGYIPPAVTNPNAGTPKDIAYRIMGQSSSENRGVGDIAKGVLESLAAQPYDQMYTGSFSGGNEDMDADTTRDLNHLIVYGNTKGQYQPKELRGFDYSDYLKKNYGVSTMPTYEGRIVMANKVNIPTEYGPLVEWLSDRPKYGYYVDPDKDTDVIQDWDSLPFLTVDDTASYRRSFRRDKNGKPELANQDLIDYGGGDYGRKYGILAGLQGAVLSKVINSPVILDQGLPVNFTDNPEDFEQGEGWYNSLKGIVDRNHILQNNNNGDYSYPLLLPDVNVYGRKHSEGGNIHIKDSKKGTFTAAASRHNMGVQEFASKVPAHKDNYSPAMVKKANFARDFGGKKHLYGGILQGPLIEQAINEYMHGGPMGNYYDGWGDYVNFLRKGYNKAKGYIQKGREVVHQLGLDRSPSQHLVERVEKVKSSRPVGNNNLDFTTEAAITAAKSFGLDKRYKGNKDDIHYRQNIFNYDDPTSAVPSTVGEAFEYLRIAEKAKTDKDLPYWRKYIEPTADAGWAKRLGLPYDNTLLINNPDGSVHLSEQIESEIPTDTVFIKNRIDANEKKLNSIYGAQRQVINAALDFDRKTLESLRHTYKTGEPVEMNEHSYISRNWQGLKPEEIGPTPLSVMHRYTGQYDKDKNVFNYWDIYNFDEFEDFVPGEPFEIRGSINLNR